MHSSPPSKGRSAQAEASITALFAGHGWRVARQPEGGTSHPGLVVSKGAHRFVAEIKALAEGRADRVIPLLSQTILQARAHALDTGDAQPLAIIQVKNASDSLVRQLASFVERFAPDAAVGLVCDNGFRYFRGAGLDAFNAEPERLRGRANPPLAQSQSANLFSDLNQWMLKVLLAPDIPDHLLKAPRQRYESGAGLAQACYVSAMSASRFLKQLRKEGYLDESSRYLALVRRRDLFRRWQAAAVRSPAELPMRFLIRGQVQDQVRSLVASTHGGSCLALFSAAQALGLGHVSGVLPHVYVQALPRPGDKKWRALAIASPSDKPDVIVRQANSPQSVFRGAVHRDGLLVSDVIQTWLDVGGHPSRGQEQASLIHDKVLRPLMEE